MGGHMKQILVTGGMGYIGSHTCVMLLNDGYEVVIVDNLYNSEMDVLTSIELLTGKKPKFVKCDVTDMDALEDVFKQFSFEAVIHFAGMKAVGESVSKPIMYYDNNLCGTINLLKCMALYKCKNLVFSSSATVYGDQPSPMIETYQRFTTNPYGATKRQIEEILEDVSKADSEWSIHTLRYFNPVGAHPSGLLGENPKGIPNNLVPYIAKTAIGELEVINVFGDDYDTHDGTGVRDYIHVMDLAEGHLKSLVQVFKSKGLEAINLGTGKGSSVLEMIQAFEKASDKKINYRIVERRPGDVATCFADVSKARDLLGWSAKYSIDDMCRDHWNYQVKHQS